jgi:hypothetical protein
MPPMSGVEARTSKKAPISSATRRLHKIWGSVRATILLHICSGLNSNFLFENKDFEKPPLRPQNRCK